MAAAGSPSSNARETLVPAKRGRLNAFEGHLTAVLDDYNRMKEELKQAGAQVHFTRAVPRMCTAPPRPRSANSQRKLAMPIDRGPY